VLKERIQEIFEFTKSESPYRKANKGWISQDIFLDLSPSPDPLKQKNETAEIILFWSPVNSLLINIFLVILIGSILVFTSTSFVKGRFNFNIFNTSFINNIVKVEENKVENITQSNVLDYVNPRIEYNSDTNNLEKQNPINSTDDSKINADQEMITNKIDKEENIIKDIESRKDIKVLKNKKVKSNFI